MFVITFIDNHRVNTVIYSAGIGLSFSHKFQQVLINSTQWTSTTWPHTWTESISKAVNLSEVFWSGAHIHCRGSIILLQKSTTLIPQPVKYPNTVCEEDTCHHITTQYSFSAGALPKKESNIVGLRKTFSPLHHSLSWDRSVHLWLLIAKELH